MFRNWSCCYLGTTLRSDNMTTTQHTIVKYLVSMLGCGFGCQVLNYFITQLKESTFLPLFGSHLLHGSIPESHTHIAIIIFIIINSLLPFLQVAIHQREVGHTLDTGGVQLRGLVCGLKTSYCTESLGLCARLRKWIVQSSTPMVQSGSHERKGHIIEIH